MTEANQPTILVAHNKKCSIHKDLSPMILQCYICLYFPWSKTLAQSFYFQRMSQTKPHHRVDETKTNKMYEV